MGIYRWLGQLLRPCVHTWRIVSKMEDDPKAPTNVHIVRECEICGELEVQKFHGPKRACPPHKWITTQRSAVWGKEGDKFPTHHRVEQHCEICGEARAVDLKPITLTKEETE